jgi:hypothetical protein
MSQSILAAHDNIDTCADISFYVDLGRASLLAGTFAQNFGLGYLCIETAHIIGYSQWFWLAVV